MEDKIKEEIEKMEKQMSEMESQYSSMGFSGSAMLGEQLLINQSWLKIAKLLAGYSKEKDWI